MLILSLALARFRRSGAVAALDAQQRLQVGLLPGLLRAVQVLLTVRLLLTQLLRLLLLCGPLRCWLLQIPLLRYLHILKSSTGTCKKRLEGGIECSLQYS